MNTSLKTLKSNRLQSKLGYQFVNKLHFDQALTHRSFGKNNNERLEFLGDALLGIIIAESLYSKFPLASEGQLTQIRSSLVKGDTLAKLARGFDLGEHLSLGEGELKSGGFRRSSILEDAMEAMIGAIYLDCGGDFSRCKTVVLQWYQDLLSAVNLASTSKDYKTQLQEFLQNKNFALPVYEVVKELGDAHDRQFVVSCSVDKFKAVTQAEGPSKRSAEKAAAKIMLEKIN